VSLSEYTGLINPSIVRELFRHRYDAIWLHGYSYVTHLLAFLTARLTGTPIFYRSESTLTYDRVIRRSWMVRRLKPPLLRRLFRGVSTFLATGTMNADFYRHYGVDNNRIFLVPYTVDNDFFIERVAKLRACRDESRAAMGISPDTVAFLFPAKLIPIKRPLQALAAHRVLLPSKKTIFCAWL